ncbi:MAG: phospholipase, partial [Methanospirillum sp.]|nr:phospholipase [Methanospirillum sp.]
MFLVAGAGAVPWISEVYPDTWMKGDDDEYLTVCWDTNPGEISISDGEGTITLVLADNPEHSCTIARNGEAYRRIWGKSPEYELIDSSPVIPEPGVTGKFQLANKKDELVLTRHNVKIQNISWPGSFTGRQGQIHTRSPQGTWDERVLMAGGSRFTPVTFTNASGTAFVSPDCSRDILEKTIRETDTEILLNVYEFTDTGLARDLCEAAARG